MLSMCVLLSCSKNEKCVLFKVTTNKIWKNEESIVLSNTHCFDTLLLVIDEEL